MSKVHTRVLRKDWAVEDHAHKMPDGSMSSSALYKPNKDRTYMHTHLIQYKGKTCETCPAPIGAGHTHGSDMGESGPSVPVSKGIGPEIPFDRNDSAERPRKRWGARMDSVGGGGMGGGGGFVGYAAAPKEAQKDYDAYDADEVAAKAQLGDVDEGKWEKAKKATIAQYGHIKYPVVQTIYKNMGGE